MQPTHSLSNLPQTHVPSAHGNASAQTKTSDGDSSTDDGITHSKTLQTQHYQTSRTISSEAYSVDLQSQRTLTNNERDTLSHTLTYSVNYRSESQSSTSIEQTTKVNNTPALLDGARNILQFIEQRVASEQADGASTDELSELIDQGLSGFLQGFDEAKNLLGDDKALNDLSLIHI